MTRLQTALILFALSAAVLAACVIALGWLMWTQNWPLIVPEGLRDCLEWNLHGLRDPAPGGFMRCLP